MTPDQKRMTEDAERLRAMEVDYVRARDFLASSAALDERSGALVRIRAIVDASATRGVEYAPVALGQISEVLYQLARPSEVVRRYETLKRRLDGLHGRAGEDADA